MPRAKPPSNNLLLEMTITATGGSLNDLETVLAHRYERMDDGDARTFKVSQGEYTNALRGRLFYWAVRTKKGVEFDLYSPTDANLKPLNTDTGAFRKSLGEFLVLLTQTSYCSISVQREKPHALPTHW